MARPKLIETDAVIEHDFKRALQEGPSREIPKIRDRKERLFYVLEYDLGREMSWPNVVVAIERGAGQEHVLALQEFGRQDNGIYLRAIMPNEVVVAIMNYLRT
jgi:hypothetical protein